MRIEMGLAVAETRGERGKMDCQDSRISLS
jgi:hypothetical protein